MKKTDKQIIATLILLAVVLIFGSFSFQDSNDETAFNNISEYDEMVKKNDDDAYTHGNKKIDSKTDFKDNVSFETVAIVEDQKKIIERSVKAFTKNFAEFQDSSFKKDDFIDFLRGHGLNPEVNIDDEEGLETLTTIRTEDTLEGIRHIHAQYEGDSYEKEILQHLSFELSPSETAFKDAQRILKESISDLGKEDEDTTENMIVFRKDGYIIWVAKLTQDDIDNDPFNPRTQEDVGSVKIAIEFDIHPPHIAGNDEEEIQDSNYSHDEYEETTL